ncbi:MAG: histidine decarboxylase [bacterium]|nr:histidine decarboxylase [bacterium]
MSNKNNKDKKRNFIKFGPSQLPWDQQTPYGAVVTGPTKDPLDEYVTVPPENVKGGFPRIDYSAFEIPPNGMTDQQRSTALAQLKRVVETQHADFMGFQANQDEEYSDYAWLLNMHLNNLGDPFTGGLFTLNSKFCERAVLDYFAALWNVDWPFCEDEKQPSLRYWGYVLTMGFTEGNIYGLYNARDYLKGRMLIEETTDPKANVARFSRGKEVPVKKTLFLSPADSDKEREDKKPPIIFFSEDAHYSVVKAARILEITTFFDEGQEQYNGQCPITQHLKGENKGAWPKDGVPSHNFDEDNPDSGTVRIEYLKELVEFFVKRHYPVIIVLNVGSTWKGAYDDVPAVNDMLKELEKTYPDLWEHTFKYKQDGEEFEEKRRSFWVHVDGALGAAYIPFLEMAYNQRKIEQKPPRFDFRNEVVMSIGCSLHKWPGLPIPSGIFMTRRMYQLQPPAKVGYIGSPDTTLGGSRSGVCPILAWDYFSRMSYTDNMMKALKCENASKYFEQKLLRLEECLKEKYPDKDVDLWIARSKMSLTVRFRMVNPELTYKYSVDNERMYVRIDDKKLIFQERSYSHVYFMHSARHTKADQLIKDISDACEKSFETAFPKKDGDKPNPGEIFELKTE